MSNRKATFAKRQREMDLKDHAKAKEERRAARQSSAPKDTKGPQIAWDEQFVPPEDAPPVAGSTPQPTPPASTDSASTPSDD
jgi:hypothetical protein